MILINNETRSSRSKPRANDVRTEWDEIGGDEMRAKTEYEKVALRSKSYLRYLISGRGMSVKDLSDEIGVPLSTLYCKINNPERMSMADLKRIVIVTHATPEERSNLIDAYGL